MHSQILLVGCRRHQSKSTSDSESHSDKSAYDHNEQDDKAPKNKAVLPEAVPVPVSAPIPVQAPQAESAAPKVADASAPNVKNLQTAMTGVIADGAKMWKDFWGCVWGL